VIRKLSATILLLVCTAPVFAQDWDRVSRQVDAALEGHDAGRWHAALLGLSRHDHAGGENALFGTRDPAAAFDWWRNSPGHRRNLLSPGFTEIGVGEVGGFWTQNFGKEPRAEDHDREK